MPPAIMLLGPTQPRREPGVARTSLTVSPLEARRLQAQMLRELFEIPGIVMEDAASRPGETNAGKFTRLVREHDVRTFSVLIPLGMRLQGLEVEFGFLLERLERDELEPDDVQLLVERGVQRITEDGELTGTVLAHAEEGNRTRYHGDFEDYGCPIRTWGGQDALFRHTAVLATDHRARHAAPPGEERLGSR